MARAGAPGHDAVRRRPRRRHRQRRAALDRARAGLLPGQPRLGRQRLHPHLRRLPAARRPPGRPARPAQALHDRPRRLLDRVAARRPGPIRRLAHRRARPAGPRRRARLPRRAVDRDQHLRRGRRAQQGAGRLGRGRRLGRRRGRAARRHAHRVPRLGVGAVRQRADRRRRRAARPATAGREPRRGRRALLRPRRRRDGHGRPVAARLHARRRQQRRLGIDEDDRASARCRSRCSPPSS